MNKNHLKPGNWPGLSAPHRASVAAVPLGQRLVAQHLRQAPLQCRHAAEQPGELLPILGLALLPQKRQGFSHGKMGGHVMGFPMGKTRGTC